MTPTVRRTALVVIALLLTACRSQIQHGLTERDANEITTALVSRGFDAKKAAEKGKKPTWAIEVDDEHATDALRVLTELKLPRPPRTTTREIASQTGLIETPGAERLRQLEALEGDIEQMIEGMDGITSAGVELVVPAPPRPGQSAAASKASALLRAHPASLERLLQQRDAIRALIAASVDGLKPEDVMVLIDPVTTQVPTPAAPPPATDRMRSLAIVLGMLVTALAIALVAVALRIRQRPAAKAAPALPAEPAAIPRASTPVMPRPVVNPNVQRRVA